MTTLQFGNCLLVCWTNCCVNASRLLLSFPMMIDTAANTVVPIASSAPTTGTAASTAASAPTPATTSPVSTSAPVTSGATSRGSGALGRGGSVGRCSLLPALLGGNFCGIRGSASGAVRTGAVWTGVLLVGGSGGRSLRGMVIVISISFFKFRRPGWPEVTKRPSDTHKRTKPEHEVRPARETKGFQRLPVRWVSGTLRGPA